MMIEPHQQPPTPYLRRVIVTLGSEVPDRYLASAAYSGPNEDRWRQLSSAPEQRFVILGGKVSTRTRHHVGKIKRSTLRSFGASRVR